MWPDIVFILLAGMPAGRGTGYTGYQYYETNHEDAGDADFDDRFINELPETPTRMATAEDALSRIKRYKDLNDIRTLNPDEIKDVKGALNKILFGKPDALVKQPENQEYVDIYDYIDKTKTRERDTRNYSGGEAHGNIQNWSPLQKVPQKWSPSKDEAQKWTPLKDDAQKSSDEEIHKWSPLEIEVQTLSPSQDEVQKWSTSEDQVKKWSPTRGDIAQSWSQDEVQKWLPSKVEIQIWSPSRDEVQTLQPVKDETRDEIQTLTLSGDMDQTWSLSGYEPETWSSIGDGVQKWTPSKDKDQNWSSSRDDAQTSTPSRDEAQKWSPSKDNLKESPSIKVQHWEPTLEERIWDPNEMVPITQPETRTYNTEEVKADVQKLITLGGRGRKWSYSDEEDYKRLSTDGQHLNATILVQNWNPIDTEETVLETRTYRNEEVKNEMAKLMPLQNTSLQEFTSMINVKHWRKITEQQWSALDDADQTLSNIEDSDATSIRSTTVEAVPLWEGPRFLEGLPFVREGDTTPKRNTTSKKTRKTTTNTTTTTPEPTIRSPRMDINAIIAIIANLTYDYDWNLTEQFNKSLIDHGVPTCPTDTTATTTSTTPSPYDFSNSSVVGKCFVCGLKDLEIPRGAHCADAFAGDFLPLVPVDPRARGQIATFRKYCRYLDVNNFVENPSEVRSIYGRFTGGCGVRWTDLTGVYTQRTCRSRFRPLMGRHFASKRMAKLELALVNVENGCIISPMASLLPLSRGISLYARFHACVCTGSWCNRARLPPVARAAAALACALPRLLA